MQEEEVVVEVMAVEVVEVEVAAVALHSGHNRHENPGNGCFH